jgi:hypothetical protein
MKKSVAYLAAALFVTACGQPQQAPTTQRTAKDPRVTAIEERVAKTTGEGKKMIERAKGLKPLVNEQLSGKTLGEVVDDFANNKGAYNINVIGWEASEKKNKRWKIVLNFQDYQKAFLAAEWEYNPETGYLYPFELQNAKIFFAAEGAVKASEAAKAKK